VQEVNIDAVLLETLEAVHQLIFEKIGVDAVPAGVGVFNHIGERSFFGFALSREFQVLALDVARLGNDDHFVAVDLLVANSEFKNFADEEFAVPVRFGGRGGGRLGGFGHGGRSGSRRIRWRSRESRFARRCGCRVWRGLYPRIA